MAPGFWKMAIFQKWVKTVAVMGVVQNGQNLGFLAQF